LPLFWYNRGMFIELAIIFSITLLVRLISVNTGGGALILLPLLMFFGLSPSEAIATNRAGALSYLLSIIRFHKSKQVKWRLGFSLLIPNLIGVILGTILVVHIDQSLFEKIIGIVMLVGLPLLFLKDKIGLKEIKLTKKRFIIGLFLSFIAGFLGGLVALTGIWFNYVYLFLGLTFLQTAGTKKVASLITVPVSVVIFIFTDLINWPMMLAMFLGSAIGAWVGAGLGLKVGNFWIKRLFVVVVIVSAIKILFF